MRGGSNREFHVLFGRSRDRENAGIETLVKQRTRILSPFNSVQATVGQEQGLIGSGICWTRDLPERTHKTLRGHM